MTTGWLLLLLLIVSSQSVDSQSTTDDETCGEGGLLSELQSDMQRLLDNQQTILNRLGKSCFQLLILKLYSSLAIMLHATNSSHTRRKNVLTACLITLH